MRFIFAIVLFPLLLSSQIIIPNVGDGWKTKVQQAIEVIKKYDLHKYNVLIYECKQIDFGLASFATSDGKSTIILPVEVLNRGCINDIAACLVHESLHIQFSKAGNRLGEDFEEVICYKWELDFLQKIPNAERWLISNALYQIGVYSTR
jgi:hypothetical protein